MGDIELEIKVGDHKVSVDLKENTQLLTPTRQPNSSTAPTPSEPTSPSFNGHEEKHEEKHGGGFEEGVLPPDIFPGVKKCDKDLKYILLSDAGNATVQSKLDTLGARGFRLIAALFSRSLGRSILGYHYRLWPKKWGCPKNEGKEAKDRKSWCQDSGLGEKELILLPNVYSKGYAVINVYIRVMLLAALCIGIAAVAYLYSGAWLNQGVYKNCTQTSNIADFNNALTDACTYYWLDYYDDVNNQSEITPDMLEILDEYCYDQQANVVDANPGMGWTVGITVSLFLLFNLRTFSSSAKAGSLPFLRSMGRPNVEEYMFSYSWAKEAEDIRTLAKSMWQNDVGVWLDVVKLESGDAIAPVVRTMMKSVYRCVIFLSAPYLTSANCCVEIQEAIKCPSKIIICLLDNLPQLDDYLQFLQKCSNRDIADERHESFKGPGFKICRGIPELMGILDHEIKAADDAALRWWKRQRIAVSGAPEYVAARAPLPMFAFYPRLPPLKSLACGPVFIAGSCTESGKSFFPPWLFILALFGLAFNTSDIYSTVHGKGKKIIETYLLLGVFLGIVLAPFFEIKGLLDTRRWVHTALKPLLASAALEKRIKVLVKGDAKDPVVHHLRQFLRLAGFAAEQELHEYENNDAELKLYKDHISVLVINSIDARNRYLLSCDRPKLEHVMKTHIVIFSGKENLFAGGEKLYPYLQLVQRDLGDGLGLALFSSISIRAVNYLHHGHEQFDV